MESTTSLSDILCIAYAHWLQTMKIAGAPILPEECAVVTWHYDVALNGQMSPVIYAIPSMFNAIRCMSSKIFVGGLSYQTDDHSLKEAFSSFGEVTDARVITDRESGRCRGFGFVNFNTDESANEAMKSMDGQLKKGGMLGCHLGLVLVSLMLVNLTRLMLGGMGWIMNLVNSMVLLGNKKNQPQEKYSKTCKNILDDVLADIQGILSRLTVHMFLIIFPYTLDVKGSYIDDKFGQSRMVAL
ncbi:RNA-binding glycine-rich protein [Tanacetum coccineum]